MVGPTDHEALDAARRRAGLSVEDLWLRYFELGGLASLIELDAFLRGALRPVRLEHDILAHALNEALIERGQIADVAYLFRGPPDPAQEDS